MYFHSHLRCDRRLSGHRRDGSDRPRNARFRARSTADNEQDRKPVLKPKQVRSVLHSRLRTVGDKARVGRPDRRCR